MEEGHSKGPREIDHQEREVLFRRREQNLIVLVLLIGLGASAARAQSCPGCVVPHPEDVFVCGCVPANAGEIGAKVVAGDLFESVTVPVIARTYETIRSFGFDLQFPSQLLRYDSTSVGKATEHFDFFSAHIQSASNILRVGGAENGLDTIASQTTATMAVVHFTVIASGCDAFLITSVFDDLSGYTGCSFASVVGAPAIGPPYPGIHAMSAHPNPFDASVTIDFALPVPSRVWIDVYDPAGRKVVSLVEGEGSEGSGRHVWSGLDHRGQSVPAGVYFVRLRTEGDARYLKVLRVQ
jgi:hypothetical protein